MRFDHMLISFLLLSFFVISGVLLIGDMNEKYAHDGIEVQDEDFGDVYNTIDDMYDVSKSTKEATLDGDISETDSWESMTKGSYSAVRLLGGSFKLFTDITNAISKKLGIPSFVTKMAFIMFTISIVFGIVYMIFRFQPS